MNASELTQVLDTVKEVMEIDIKPVLKEEARQTAQTTILSLGEDEVRKIVKEELKSEAGARLNLLIHRALADFLTGLEDK